MVDKKSKQGFKDDDDDEIYGSGMTTADEKSSHVVSWACLTPTHIDIYLLIVFLFCFLFVLSFDISSFSSIKMTLYFCVNAFFVGVAR